MTTKLGLLGVPATAQSASTPTTSPRTPGPQATRLGVTGAPTSFISSSGGRAVAPLVITLYEWCGLGGGDASNTGGPLEIGGGSAGSTFAGDTGGGSASTTFDCDQNVGAPTLSLAVQPTGIVSQEEVRGPSLAQTAGQIRLSGIASAEAFGGFIILPGTLTIGALAIASREAFGATVLQLAGVPVLTPSGIASGEIVSAPTVAPGAVSVTLAGIVTREAFGTAVLSQPSISAKPDRTHWGKSRIRTAIARPN